MDAERAESTDDPCMPMTLGGTGRGKPTHQGKSSTLLVFIRGLLLPLKASKADHFLQETQAGLEKLASYPGQ